MTTPAHPQRCETCTKKDCYHYPEYWRKTGLWSLSDHEKQWKFTAEYGCASHSSVKSRDQVLDEVRVKLSELKTAYPTGADFVWWLVIDTALDELRTKGSRDP